MKFGNWVPISKALIKYFPKDRPYTKLEAAMSLQVDYDNKNSVTLAGYSALWSWSRNKVRKFLSDMGVEIIYPLDTQKLQNQKGQIRVQIRDRQGTDKGQIRLIDYSSLKDKKDRKRTDKGQIKDRSRYTTNDPNPNPDTKKNKYSELNNVFLTKKEYTKLKEKFNSALDSKIENLSLYIASKGKKYKSHYATILAWDRRDNKTNPEPKPPKEFNGEYGDI